MPETGVGQTWLRVEWAHGLGRIGVSLTPEACDFPFANVNKMAA